MAKKQQKKPVEKKSSSRFVYPLLLLVAVVGLYQQTTSYSYVWDDAKVHLLDNQDLMEGNIGRFWQSEYEGLYIPISNSIWTLMANATKTQPGPQQPFPLDPANFHILNIIVQILNAILVYLILLTLFKKQVYAFIGALVFTAHPMAVESIAWISEFRGLLSAFFAFLAILTYLRFREKPKLLIVPIAAYVLSILSKPQLIGLPLIVAGIEMVFYQGTWKKAGMIASVILLSIPVILFTQGAQSPDAIKYVTPLVKRPLVMMDSFGFYIQKFLLPWPLAGSYGISPDHVAGTVTIPMIIFAVLTGLVLYFGRKEKVLLLFWLILVVSTGPVSGIIPFLYQNFSTVADRYAYFFLFGIAMLVPWFMSKFEGKNIKWVPAGLAVVFAIISFIQIPVWEDELSLWSHNAEHFPGQGQIHANYGNGLIMMRELDKAEEQFILAVKYDSTRAKNWVNLGNVNHEKGKVEEARMYYEKALEVDSTSGLAYYQLAFYYDRKRNIDKAIELYGKCIQHNPEYSNAYLARATMYYQKREYLKSWDDLMVVKQLKGPYDHNLEMELRRVLSQ